jgi:hypothetical protein
VSTIHKQGQQRLNTAEQFHNRSGGTNAAGQTLMDSERAAVDDLINKLTGQAAGQIAGIGQFGLSTGLQGAGVEGRLADAALQAEQGGILGQIFRGATGLGVGKLADILGIG